MAVYSKYLQNKFMCGELSRSLKSQVGLEGGRGSLPGLDCMLMFVRET